MGPFSNVFLSFESLHVCGFLLHYGAEVFSVFSSLHFSYNCCQTTYEHFLIGIIVVILSGGGGIGIHLHVQKIISNSLQSTFMFITFLQGHVFIVETGRDPVRPNPRSHCRYQGQLVKPKPGFLSAPWCVTGSSLYWQKYGIFLLLKGTLFPLGRYATSSSRSRK